MYPTMTQVAELQKTQIDALHAVAGTLVAATERLASLHFAAARAWMLEAKQITENLFGGAEPQQALALVAELVQPSTDKLASYSRELYGVAFGTQAELSRIVESRIAEGKDKIEGIVALTFQDAPAGSEATVSLLKNAIFASNAAFDAIAKAAKQAFEMAESNLTDPSSNGAGEVAVKHRGGRSA